MVVSILAVSMQVACGEIREQPTPPPDAEATAEARLVAIRAAKPTEAAEWRAKSQATAAAEASVSATSAPDAPSVSPETLSVMATVKTGYRWNGTLDIPVFTPRQVFNTFLGLSNRGKALVAGCPDPRRGSCNGFYTAKAQRWVDEAKAFCSRYGRWENLIEGGTYNQSQICPNGTDNHIQLVYYRYILWDKREQKELAEFSLGD